MTTAHTSAEARTLLEKAREFVDSYDPSTSERSDARRPGDLRRRQQELVDALQRGLIPAGDVAQAADVLRRSFRLHLASVADRPDTRADSYDGVTVSPPARAARSALDALTLPPGTARVLPGPGSRIQEGGAARPYGPWATPGVIPEPGTTHALRLEPPGTPHIPTTGLVLSPLPKFAPPPTPGGSEPSPPPRGATPAGTLLPGVGRTSHPLPESEPDAGPPEQGADESPPAPFTTAPDLQFAEAEDSRGPLPVAVASSPRQVADASPRVRTFLLVAVLRTVGVELVLFVLFALFGTAVIQGQAQHGLDQSPTALHISAPSIGLDLVLVAGDGRSALARGPGLVPGSGHLGGTGPIVIVGARTTDGAPFRHIGALRADDVLTLRQGARSVAFTVVGVSTATPHGRLVTPAGRQALYLVTANPPYGDHSRLVISAEATAPPGPTGSVPATVVNLPALSGSPLRLVMAMGVLAVLAMGWSLRRLWLARLPALVRWSSLVPAVLGSYIFWRLLLDGFSRLL